MKDGLGSTIGLVDDTGAVTTTYAYDTYGGVMVSGPNLTEIQFTGRENDGTGLMYYRARYYSPEMQRFVSRDPISFTGGSVNLYGYVGQSPANFVDPLGLWSVSLEGYAIVGGGLVVGQNPNGKFFATARVGIGGGGGIQIDPSGSSPGYEEAALYGRQNIRLGLFAAANIAAGPLTSGINIGDGVHLQSCPDKVKGYSFRDISPLSFDYGKGLRFGASTGMELSIWNQ